MDTSQKRPKLIDKFVYNGRTVECYLMPKGTLLILYFKTASREIIESYNSIKDHLDEIGIADKFDEIKTRIINESVVRPLRGKRKMQTNLFASA